MEAQIDEQELTNDLWLLYKQTCATPAEFSAEAVPIIQQHFNKSLDAYHMMLIDQVSEKVKGTVATSILELKQSNPQMKVQSSDW